MTKKITLNLFLLSVIILNAGCFSAFQTFNTSNKTPVYLHVPTTGDYTYFINGEKIEPKFTVYSSKRISENATSTTYQSTSIPALRVKANKAYVLLKIVDNKTKMEKEYVLKSGLMQGAKIVMYWQGMFTLGIGNAIDMAANSVYAWPEISLN